MFSERNRVTKFLSIRGCSSPVVTVRRKTDGDCHDQPPPLPGRSLVVPLRGGPPFLFLFLLWDWRGRSIDWNHTRRERERFNLLLLLLLLLQYTQECNFFFLEIKTNSRNSSPVQGLTNKSIEFQSLFHRCYIHESSPIETLIKE